MRIELRDWLALIAAILAVGGLLFQVAINIAMRTRDREDHEALAKRVAELSDDISDLGKEVAELRGHLKGGGRS